MVTLLEDIRGQVPDAGKTRPPRDVTEREMADITVVSGNSSMETSERSLRQSQRHQRETEVKDLGFFKRKRWRKTVLELILSSSF